MSTLVEKLKEFAKYEAGKPIIRRARENILEAARSWKQHDYGQAIRSAGSVPFNAGQVIAWHGFNLIEILGMYIAAENLITGDPKKAAYIGLGIGLFELAKNIMAHPSRYSIVRPYKNTYAGPHSGKIS